MRYIAGRAFSCARGEGGRRHQARCPAPETWSGRHNIPAGCPGRKRSIRPYLSATPSRNTPQIFLADRAPAPPRPAPCAPRPIRVLARRGAVALCRLRQLPPLRGPHSVPRAALRYRQPLCRPIHRQARLLDRIGRFRPKSRRAQPLRRAFHPLPPDRQITRSAGLHNFRPTSKYGKLWSLETSVFERRRCKRRRG